MTESDHDQSRIPTSSPVVREASTPALTLTLVSLFPSIFTSWLQQGVVARAVARGLVTVDLIDLRPFGVGKHRITDDYPFGGGVGMVMKPEPLFDAVESLALSAGTPVVLMSPRGRPFTQRVAEELAIQQHVVLLSGHYEGVDERVREHLVTDEISIGDYVLSAGELAAMVVCDATTRLIPGVLAESATLEESFAQGLLEYPHYTRPAVYRGWQVPDVLVSGHHAHIEQWRREQAKLVTAERRPDLLGAHDSTADIPVASEFHAERPIGAIDSTLRDDAGHCG